MNDPIDPARSLKEKFNDINEKSHYLFTHQTIDLVARGSERARESFLDATNRAMDMNGIKTLVEFNEADPESHVSKMAKAFKEDGTCLIYVVTTEDGKEYTVREEQVFYGNCTRCYTAMPLGVRCKPSGDVPNNEAPPRSQKLYFARDIEEYRYKIKHPLGRDTKEIDPTKVLKKLSPANPFKLSWDIMAKAPIICMDVEYYSQGGYTKDIHTCGFQLHRIDALIEQIQQARRTPHLLKTFHTSIRDATKAEWADIVLAVASHQWLPTEWEYLLQDRENESKRRSAEREARGSEAE